MLARGRPSRTVGRKKTALLKMKGLSIELLGTFLSWGVSECCAFHMASCSYWCSEPGRVVCVFLSFSASLKQSFVRSSRNMGADFTLAENLACHFLMNSWKILMGFQQK